MINHYDFPKCIEEFSETLREDYPHLSNRQIKNICSAPWKMFKEMMKNSSTDSIRFQHFGQFQVNLGTAIYYYYKLYRNVKGGIISEEFYIKYEKVLKNYIETELYRRLEKLNLKWKNGKVKEGKYNFELSKLKEFENKYEKAKKENESP